MAKKTLKDKIKTALDMANDLCYDDKCKKDLLNATSEIQIENIMISARRRCND